MKIKTQLIAAILLITSGLMFLSSCDDVIIGSGRVVQEAREVGSFNAIDISGAFTVYLSQGDEESLVLETDDNLMELVDTYVRGGRLYIETRGIGIRNSTMKAHITVKDLKEIEASGAVKIIGKTSLNFDRLDIDVSGAAEIEMELYGNRMDLEISGAGKSYLKGEVEKVRISLSGASKTDAEELYTRVMNVDISGAGSARVNVRDQLSASVSGAGSVRYIGDPNVQSSVSGAGKVSKIKH